MKRAAAPGSMASMAERKFRKMNAPSSAKIESGTRARLKRPVRSDTTMTTANTPSGGAGSTATTPNSRNPSATAAS